MSFVFFLFSSIAEKIDFIHCHENYVYFIFVGAVVARSFASNEFIEHFFFNSTEVILFGSCSVSIGMNRTCTTADKLHIR